MAEFCKCGSLVINGICTNKKCSSDEFKAPAAKTGRSASAKAASAKAASAKAASAKADSASESDSETDPTLVTATVKNAVKSTKTPRASKCITYKIGDLPPADK
ncbi:MAG: hypothetical protein HGA22_03295 [Clostridiales bacterium]|nr:hypothetical protein [Clostridiales bacterium]